MPDDAEISSALAVISNQLDEMRNGQQAIFNELKDLTEFRIHCEKIITEFTEFKKSRIDLPPRLAAVEKLADRTSLSISALEAKTQDHDDRIKKLETTISKYLNQIIGGGVLLLAFSQILKWLYDFGWLNWPRAP